jgi:hypothetical protein
MNASRSRLVVTSETSMFDTDKGAYGRLMIVILSPSASLRTGFAKNL